MLEIALLARPHPLGVRILIANPDVRFSVRIAAMIHVRVVSPPELTAQLMPLLVSDTGVMNLTVTAASMHNPEGDAIRFDVLQGRANEVIARMRGLGVDQRGSIILEPVTTSL